MWDTGGEGSARKKGRLGVYTKVDQDGLLASQSLTGGHDRHHLRTHHLRPTSTLCGKSSKRDSETKIVIIHV